MGYLGGKHRLAPRIRDLIETLRGERQRYVEPFLGGGSVFAAVAPGFQVAMAGDTHADLVEMWREVGSGRWTPPTVVTQEQYRDRDSMTPEMRAFVGFWCSFGGKWFAGYARGDGRNYALQAAVSVMNKALPMLGRRLEACDFEAWDEMVDAGTVVYCDPPYAGTEPYDGVGRFDHDRFWRVMERWAMRGAVVLVSEYRAPEGWTVTAEWRHLMSVSRTTRTERVERVFAQASERRA